MSLEKLRQKRLKWVEANLRRAVSTTYYALFHCLAACCVIVGGSGSNRALQPLQHGPARQRCERQHHRKISRRDSGFRRSIRRYAEETARC